MCCDLVGQNANLGTLIDVYFFFLNWPLQKLYSRHWHSWHYLRAPTPFSSHFFPLDPQLCPSQTPISNLLSCIHFFNILLLIYRCLSYHTYIADWCVSPWRHNSKVKQQLMDLYWHIMHVSYWFNIKQSIPNHVSFHQGMYFLLAFP